MKPQQPVWIDTHTHFDASEFEKTRLDDWQKAQALGVTVQVVPSIAPFNFDCVRTLSTLHEGTGYALGIHPMYVMPLALDESIAALRHAILNNINDPKLIAIGEIGLDGFITNSDIDKQIDFFKAQLNLAREFDLPVILHVRHAQDAVIKYLRQYSIKNGIAHAFNGSFSQADAYIKQGLKLGFGGMMTFDKANQIRRLASELPIESLVLETDAPDIPPSWAYRQNNYSYYLPKIAQVLAELRQINISNLSVQIQANTLIALPKIHHFLLGNT